jgi:hypothetical protein
MKKIKENGVWCEILNDLHTIMYMPIELGENIETSLTCGKTRSLKASPNIWLLIHGFGTFGHIISNLVHELTFNLLFLFNRVVHIPKYSLLELR